ncbi:MAG: colicin-D [Schlesneria sp.]|nr:colicin-D [Schlesneria sp.]
MSHDLTVLARKFADGNMSAVDFANDFISCWKSERDDGRLLQDPPEVSEALSSIFCFADLYNPQSDREEYEFDEERLRQEIKRVLHLKP